ncbi:MAG: AMIN domain-containing protein [Leptolyngbya sp. DLM2.Bin15]|nr:MAG: AMIN domain-containing protein [Leptolyngbya sp. DLM2.Bin15]
MGKSIRFHLRPTAIAMITVASRLALGTVGLGLPMMLGAAPLQAAQLTQWSFDASSRSLTVTVPNGRSPDYFLLAQPPRIVINLPGTDVGNVPTEQSYSGMVRHIRVGQFQPGTARIVIELAPDVVFAPGQVELRPIEGDRWVIRPLLEGDTPSVAAAPPDVSVDSSRGDVEFSVPAPTSPSPVASPSPSPPPAPTTSSSLPSANVLPELEPGAIEVMVPPPASPPPVASPAPVQEPAPALEPVIEPRLETDASDDRAEDPEEPEAPAPAAAQPVVVEPPASSTPSRPTDTVDFGQPLPTNTPAMPETPAIPETSATVVAASPSIWLPAGTVLTLRYPGERSLDLPLAVPRQEVLLVSQPVVDTTGQVLVPVDSQVLGRFESSSSGSRFVVQALSVNGQNIRVTGQSSTITARRSRAIAPEQIIDVQLTEDLAYR